MHALTSRLPPAGGCLSTRGEVLDDLLGLHPVVPLIQEHRCMSILMRTFVASLVFSAAVAPGVTQPSGSQVISQATRRKFEHLKHLAGVFCQVRLVPSGSCRSQVQPRGRAAPCHGLGFRCKH